MAIFRNFQKGKKLIGLSLSLCIAEMVRDNISEKDVVKIVAATRAPTNPKFEEVLDYYSKNFWSAFPRKAKALARRMYKAGKIEQPRTKGSQPPLTIDGKWVETMSDIKWDEDYPVG